MATLGKVTDLDPVKTESLKMRTSILNRLEIFKVYYESVHKEPIDKSHLINELVKAFMEQDRDFLKFEANHKPVSP